MVVKRINFKDCGIFTSKRSLNSIIETLDNAIMKREDKQEFNVLDAFCGDGIVGKEVASYLSNNGIDYSIFFADNNPSVLDKIFIQKNQKKVADLRYDKTGKFDIITIRYGLHDLSYNDKLNTINTISQSLNSKGIVILCDVMPDEYYKKELTIHHQNKEDLCDGSNKKVYLATSKEYLDFFKKEGIETKLTDLFLQEVFLREWLGTLKVSKEIIEDHEEFTLSLSKNFKKQYQIFEHPTKGVKMYYPVGTILGVKNE